MYLCTYIDVQNYYMSLLALLVYLQLLYVMCFVSYVSLYVCVLYGVWYVFVFVCILVYVYELSVYAMIRGCTL